MRWIGAIAALLILGACQPTARNSEPAAQDEPVARGRTQMWTQNCVRCHNARSPGYYGDREWQVAMHHMRVRCSITTQEYDAILRFLQSAN